MISPRLLCTVSVVMMVATSSCFADWPRFRGPQGSGISQDAEPTPVRWTANENIVWQTELPGAGVSSPIVVGNRVFVTCYSGYGLDRQNPGELADLKRHLVCVDAADGAVLWSQMIDAVQPEDPYSGIGVTAHGYASHTPVSDGEKVYVFFGKTGVLAFDLDGNQLWQKSVGTRSDDRRWGSSSSPILFGDLLIITASAESRALVGLDKESGQEVWRQETDGLSNVWGTPTLVNVDEGRTDLVLGVPYEFWGMNPETGKLRWYAEVMDTDQYSSSVVAADGILFGIEGRSGGSAAIKIGGKGDVTESHTVWSGNDSARFGSPLVMDGRLYYFSNGVASCLRTADGTEVFKSRLPGATGERDRGRGGPGGSRGRGGFGAQDYASPVASQDKIYYLKGDGTTYVIQAGDQFELLSTNKLTDQGKTFGGTPAISHGRLYIRSNTHLYCVGEE